VAVSGLDDPGGLWASPTRQTIDYAASFPRSKVRAPVSNARGPDYPGSIAVYRAGVLPTNAEPH